jgi:addiction module HigA family antidote
MSKNRKPLHPGEILMEDFLRPLNISMNALAMRIHVPSGRITDIVAGTRAITPDTAWRLSRFFGTSPQVWTNLQAQYELDLLAASAKEELKEIRPLEVSA